MIKLIQLFFILLITTPSIAETNLGGNLNCKLLEGNKIDAVVNKILNVNGRRVIIAHLAKDVYSVNGKNKLFESGIYGENNNFKGEIYRSRFIGEVKKDINVNNKLLINWGKVEIKKDLILMLGEENMVSLLNQNTTVGDKFIIMTTKDIDFTDICED